MDKIMEIKSYAFKNGNIKECYKKSIMENKNMDTYYSDPDGTYKLSTLPYYEYYDKTIIFLNKQIENERFNFKHHVGILTGKNGLSLRTDQFGFSAIMQSTLRKGYVYYKYYMCTKDVDFVIKCINDARTIGGSFIFPIIKCNDDRIKSLYNLNRGIGGYIEDSVDLTLYEIKEYYKLKAQKIHNEEIINIMNEKGYILLKDDDNKLIIKWLNIFNTFEDYVDKLCFHPFVNADYEIIDIVNSNVNDSLFDDKNFCKSDKIIKEKQKEYRIYSINDAKNIKKLLNNVRLMILKRSEIIEKIIQYEV